MKRALTDSALRGLKPHEAPFKLADGGGLYILAMPNGAKYWPYNYILGGKAKTLALGQYPALQWRRAHLAPCHPDAIATCKNQCADKHLRRQGAGIKDPFYLPRARPATCRTAIPFEPISALGRNQAGARPFHGHEWRRSRYAGALELPPILSALS